MSWSAFEVESSGLVGAHRGDGELLAVVLHGGPGLSDYTESLADEILEGGGGRLRVARYQQRGQRPSTTDGPITIAQFIDDVIAVLDHFDAGSAVIAGHSWGAHLAMHVAVAHPERVAGLLLLDALGGVGDGGSGTMDAVISGRIGEDGLAKLGELEASGRPPAEMAAEQLRLLWPGYFSNPSIAPPMPPIEMSVEVNTVLMSEAAKLLDDGYLERALPSLRMPSLHHVGRHSPIEPAANEATAALMSGAILDIVDTGHFTWLEQPGVVTAATRRLLASLPRP